jgi:glucose/arabinose dehydrogenase
VCIGVYWLHERPVVDLLTNQNLTIMKTKWSKDAGLFITSFTLYVITAVGCLLLFQGCKKFDEHSHSGPKNIKVDLQLVADGLVSPIQVVSARGTKNLFIVDQIGKIWLIDTNGVRSPTPFLDLSSRIVKLNGNNDERGLIGLAFHPDFEINNCRYYVYYQVPPRPGGPVPSAKWNNLSRISHFQADCNDWTTDMSTEKVLLEWDDPQMNHNGGALAFGPDEFLYIAVGDGGGANDTAVGHIDDWYAANKGGNAQNIEANFLGKILRINIKSSDPSGTPYTFPIQNPFLNAPGLDEIYAYGFRNPYRMSFDMGGDHDLIVSDAGQALTEEINLVTKGYNYGWNVREGSHCFNAANNKEVPAACPSEDNFGNSLRDPVIELNNWQNPAGGKATAIIGGHVYRGGAIEGLDGKYIFGTFSQSPATPNGELFMATRNGTSSWKYKEVSVKGHPDDLGYYIKGFGQDNEGEVYVTVSSNAGPSGTSGKVFKIIKAD